MRAYVVRRLLLAVVTVFLVSIIVFLMVRLIPGNIVDALIAQQMQIGETSDNREIEAARATIEKQLGLDRPILQQYAEWIARAVRGDLGNSLWRHTPVIEDIAIRWPVTLELGILGLLIGQLIALPIGIYSAQRQDTVMDYAARSVAIGLVAVPGFWVATLVIVFPSIWWGYQPPITYVRFFEDPLANLQMFLVAAAVLGMGMSGGTMRMMRTTMLEVLRQDYEPNRTRDMRCRRQSTRARQSGSAFPVILSIIPAGKTSRSAVYFDTRSKFSNLIIELMPA